MRLLAPLLLATALAAADQPAPLLGASLPDVQRSLTRFDASIYGTLWKDPQMAPLRAKLLASMDEQAGELGFKVSELLLSTRSAGLRLREFVANAHGDPEPRGDFMVDAGPLAERAFAAWQKGKTSKPAEVAGAAGAFVADPKEQVVIARFGTVIAGANQGLLPSVWAPAADAADATMDCDTRKLVDALIAVAGERQADELRAATAVISPYLGRTTYRSTITEKGMLERLTSANPCLWLVPVDRAQLDRLPATAMNALAVGMDGKQLWAAMRKPLLAAVAKERHCDEGEALTYLDGNLAEAGLTISFSELMEGLTGTFAIAIAPGAPFPTVTVQIPRTQALDAAITSLLGLINAEVPAQGASTNVPIPNMPLPLTLARDAGAWMLTSDPMHGDAWLAGTGGFLATPAAALACERGGPGAVLLGCSDTASVLRTMIPYLAMGLGNLPGLEPAQRQAVMQLLQTAAAKSGTGYVIAKPEEGGMAVEMRGLLTYSFFPAVLAAIAVPNLLESRISANESAAATSLKSGVFPAEIQFQAGGYADDNGNGVGEYGFFSEMSGAPVGDNKLTLSLLNETWNDPTPLINGYRFAVFLPDDRDGSVDSPDARRTVKGKAEEGFVAYAWPDEEGSGRRMFAITAAGTVYATAWDGQPPAWNALWGGGTSGWKDEPAWQPYRR
jgi:hypothetical protein